MCNAHKGSLSQESSGLLIPPKIMNTHAVAGVDGTKKDVWSLNGSEIHRA